MESINDPGDVGWGAFETLSESCRDGGTKGHRYHSAVFKLIFGGLVAVSIWALGTGLTLEYVIRIGDEPPYSESHHYLALAWPLALPILAGLVIALSEIGRLPWGQPISRWSHIRREKQRVEAEQAFIKEEERASNGRKFGTYQEAQEYRQVRLRMEAKLESARRRARTAAASSRADPRRFEDASADLARTLGYRDARTTPTGPDGGVDVRASGFVGQSKAYSSKVVSVGEINQLHGARAAEGAKDAAFFTTSGFSRQARDRARRLGIRCFVLGADGRWSEVD